MREHERMTSGLSVADRLELGDLIACYAAAVDSRDWEQVAGLFMPDGELISPDPPRSLAPVTVARGRDEIMAAMRQLEHFDCTVHHITGTVLTVTDSGASGRTTAIAHHVRESRSVVWHLIYQDEFVQTDGGWRFDRRALTIRLIESRTVSACNST
jgi:hypothetical protein